MSDRPKLSVIVCNHCGYEFPVSAVNIKQVDLKVSETRLRVMYYRCARCNALYLIQIMDDRCFELQKEYLKQKARWQANVGKHNSVEVASGHYSSAIAKQQRLANRIEKLKQQYGPMISAYLDRAQN